MKKIVFSFLTISILFCSSTYGQLIRDYGIKVGLASTNQNWIWPSQTFVTTSSTSRQGIDVGLFVQWFNIPMISALTELHYIQKGAKVTTNIPITTAQYPDGTGQYLSYTTRINYLSLPILAKLRISLGILTPYLLAGPRFDYNLSNSNTLYLNNFNKLDIGGTFGIGFELDKILPVHIGAEFCYSPTFQDSYSSQGLTAKNNSLEFLLVLSY